MPTIETAGSSPFSIGTLDAHHISVNTLFRDSRHTLWIGTDSDGIYRVSGTRVEHYAVVNGLSGNTIESIFEDREGDIWVATHQGIDRFRDVTIVTYSSRQGLLSDNVTGVLAATDGTVWMSNWTTLDALHPDGTLTWLRVNKEIPGQGVFGLTEDRKKRLWMAVDKGLQIFDGHTFKEVKTPQGRPTGFIHSLAEDRAGDVWAISEAPAPNGSLLHIVNDVVKEEISSDQLRVSRTNGIAADPNHDGVWVSILGRAAVARWNRGEADIIPQHFPGNPIEGAIGLIVRPDDFMIAASPWGVSFIRNGEQRQLSTAQGLPCNRMWSITAGGDALWLYSTCGLITLSDLEWQHWWRDPAYRPQTKILDTLDGALPGDSRGFPVFKIVRWPPLVHQRVRRADGGSANRASRRTLVTRADRAVDGGSEKIFNRPGP